MLARLAVTVLLICLFLNHLVSQEYKSEDCRIYNQTFLPGEELSFVLSYNWFVVFTEVGTVNLSIKEDTIFGKECLRLTGLGNTFNWWDKVFKVRDRYETFVDPVSLKPLYFQRNVREGGYRQDINYTFNHDDTLVYGKDRTYDNPFKSDSIKITPCTHDVISVLLYARNLNFSKYQIGDKIPVSIILDMELYDLYFRYQGIETIRLKGFGMVECIKFSVLLVEGTMFHEGEDMNVWITNDKNRIPVYAESPIIVGSVKARITNISGNRYPLSSFKR